MASSDVQLLLVWASPFSMRVEVALSLKGVSYSKLHQDLSNKSPLLVQSNPVHKKIPVLLHNGKPVCESLVIVQYVDEAFPSSEGKDLLPHDPYCRSVTRFWADFVDKKIFDKFLEIFRNAEDKQETAKAELRENLITLEEAFGTVPKEPPYFGGAEVNYVDVIMSPMVAWQEVMENFTNIKFEVEKLPRLTAWMKAMRDCPCGQVLPEAPKVTEFVSVLLQRRKEAAKAAAQT